MGSQRCAYRRPHPDPFSEQFWTDVEVTFGLSKREKEVLGMLCRGFTNCDIAERIGVAYPTLRCHVRSVYRKLTCCNRVDLILTLLHLEKQNKIPESSLRMIASVK